MNVTSCTANVGCASRVKDKESSTNQNKNRMV